MHACKGFLILFFVVSGFFVGVSGFTSNEITTFTSPDSSYEGFESFIDTVDSFLYLSVYQISSPGVAEDILELLREGKNVTIIIDDSPAGGFPENEKAILSMLLVNGAEVYSAGDEYRFYHGKFGVADNETLFITTENLGDTGFPRTGAKGNRGWGAIIEDPEISRYFTNVFFTDMSYSQTFEATSFDIVTSTETEPFSPVFTLKRYNGRFKITPVVAPEDAVEKIVSLLDSANESIYVEQFYIYKYWGKRKTGSVKDSPNPFLEHSIEAARRGVVVRILLDSTWYNIEREDPVSNYNTASYVNDIARREGLNIEARLVDAERLGIEKLHTKGVVVDGRLALVSSVNWNENSPTNNREVGVIIEGEPAQYFEEVFLYDWGIAQGKSDGADNRVVIMIVVASVISIFIMRRRR
jgi:phosphatidylserine/phosphatidylglycerophosphate/cardiolipin synthase-like enzyme